MSSLLTATYTYSGTTPVQASAAATHVDDIEVGDSTTYDYNRHSINVSTGVCHRVEFDAGIEVIADLGDVFILDYTKFVHDFQGSASFPGLQTCFALGADATWLITDPNRVPMELAWSEDGSTWTTKTGGVSGTVPAEADFELNTDNDPTPGGPGDNADRSTYTFAAAQQARYIRLRGEWKVRYYDDAVTGFLDAKIYDFRIYGSPIVAGTPPSTAPVLSGITQCCGTEHILTWTEVSGATSYTIYRDGVSHTTGIADLTYTATLQDAAAAIEWTVTAVNSSGEGPVSNTVALGPYWSRGESCSTSWARGSTPANGYSRGSTPSTTWRRGGC